MSKSRVPQIVSFDRGNPCSDLLTRQEAAAYCRISLSTLDRHRKNRTGPKASRFGRQVRYSKKDLDAFFDAQKSA